MLRGVADAVLQPANGILHLAGGLVGGAFGLQLGVAGDLASSLLDCAFGLVGGTFDTILVHDLLRSHMGFARMGTRWWYNGGDGGQVPCNRHRSGANWVTYSVRMETLMHRRGFVSGLLAGAAACAITPAFGYEIAKSDADWKKQLSPAAYDVLRPE